jgi:hypothetical protein
MRLPADNDALRSQKEAAMISTLLIALAAVALAVIGCAFIAPTNCVMDDGESAKDDAV